MTTVDRGIPAARLTQGPTSSVGRRVVDERALRDLMRRQDKISFQAEHLLSGTASSTGSARVDLLLVREQARHHSEWRATRGELETLIATDTVELVERLQQDLTSLSTVAIRALTDIRRAGGAEPATVNDCCGHYFTSAAELLRSALAVHLALEARAQLDADQVDR